MENVHGPFLTLWCVLKVKNMSLWFFLVFVFSRSFYSGQDHSACVISSLRKVFILKLVCWSGARTDIQNKESKTPFDLAKDAETAALLQHAGEWVCSVICCSNSRRGLTMMAINPDGHKQWPWRPQLKDDRISFYFSFSAPKNTFFLFFSRKRCTCFWCILFFGTNVAVKITENSGCFNWADARRAL